MRDMVWIILNPPLRQSGRRLFVSTKRRGTLFAMRSALLALLFIAGCAVPAPRWAFNPVAEEGVHAGVRVEWWYHWGFLEDEAGGKWCCFSSFFRTWKPGYPITRYQLYDLTNLAGGSRKSRSAAGAEILPLVKALSGEAELPQPHEGIPG